MEKSKDSTIQALLIELNQKDILKLKQEIKYVYLNNIDSNQIKDSVSLDTIELKKEKDSLTFQILDTVKMDSTINFNLYKDSLKKNKGIKYFFKKLFNKL